MTSRGVFIHGGFSSHSIVSSKIHIFLNFCYALDDASCQVLHKNTFLRIFFELKLLIDIFSEQVSNAFVINLKVRASYKKLFPHVLSIIKVAKNMIKSIWDDTFLALVSLHSNHGMGLTASSLPICEYSAVITVHDGFDQGKSTFVIHPSLTRLFVVNSIVGKYSTLVLLTFVWGTEHHLVRAFVNFNTIDTASIFFLGVHRPNSDHYLNAFFSTFSSHIKKIVVVNLIF